MLSLAPQSIKGVCIYCKFSTWLKKLYIFQTWDLVSPRQLSVLLYNNFLSDPYVMFVTQQKWASVDFSFGLQHISINMLMLNYYSYLPVSNLNKSALFCLQFFEFSKSVRLLVYMFAFLVSFFGTVIWLDALYDTYTLLCLIISWFYSM
jgi:hypothetical protein